VLATIFLAHWGHWIIERYWPEVRGNVYAVVPCGLAAFLWLRSRHLAVLVAHEELKIAHAEHARKLDKLLDKLDPSTDGGITEVHAAITEVKDQLNVDTPGSLQVVVERITTLGKSVAKLHEKADASKVTKRKLGGAKDASTK
jgi:hypothetical protein